MTRFIWTILLVGGTIVLGAIVLIVSVARSMQSPDLSALQSIVARGKHVDSATESLVVQCFELADKYPNTTGELGALYLAASVDTQSDLSREARERFRARLERADLSQISEAIGYVPTRTNNSTPLARMLLDRVKESLDDPEAARLVASTCALSAFNVQGKVPPQEFVEASELIAARYASSPEVASFCECLGVGFGSPPWAPLFEQHLKTILAQNQDRRVRCAALFALASTVQMADNRQAEAEALYKKFLQDFDGRYEYSNQSVEEFLNHAAQEQLDELKHRAVGKPSPEIVGADLKGQPLKLSDFRGKVVLLSFWSTWCFPCMKLIPEERELADKFRNEDFAIVGVNGDVAVEPALSAETEMNLSWRSFQDRQTEKRRISEDWKIIGWPTLYLIDRQGVIRARWIGRPESGELYQSITAVLNSSERNVNGRSHSPSDSANVKESQGQSAAEDIRRPRLQSREYVRADGYRMQYVVLIPPDYNSKQEYPLVVFLHGAFRTSATSGIGAHDSLANEVAAITFQEPFIGLFPCSSQNDWRASSYDGQCALSIIEVVEREFAVDRCRIYLTGYSMGGEGTWSLAAAHPEKWAAIVPICGGGNPMTAKALKNTPCWCFHGDADRVINVGLSRKMIEALTDVGARPLYTEYSSTGHNCWLRTYKNSDLFEWLFHQNKCTRSNK